MAGRGKRGGDVAGDIRAAFIRAVKGREPENKASNSKKKSLSEIIDELLDENPIGLFNAMKGFVPKQIDLDASLELTAEEWLEEMADRQDDDRED